MKFKKIFTTLAAASLLAGGALFVGESAKSHEAKEAKATTDIGTITVSEVRNAISNASTLYLLPTQNYGLPDSWDYAYVGVGDEDGVFVNGVKQNGAALKYAGTGSAYITFHYGLPSAATEGTVVEFKGQFESAASGYSFTMNFATQRFAETWILALEDYDILSLADANMPNFSSGAAINTDDMGSDYNYVTDAAGLPKQKGFFGLTNSTGSYAFQFNYKKTTTGTGWFHVLIGGQGPLWNSGHFMDFGFLDSWATTGHAQIHEYKGNGNNWAADLIQETGAIALGWNVGQFNLLEMGTIKVKNSSQYYVFFKVNGDLKFGEYWTLDSSAGGRTTKVCLQYANTDAFVENSLNPAESKLHFSSYVPAARQIYLSTATDICPAVNNWTDYFMSVDGNGIQLNDVAYGASSWNYFKKTGTNQFFLGLSDIGITPVSGDILYIGGMFKTARTVDGVKVLFKANFADSYFQFDGTEWHDINPGYLASDFAVDLLKMTMSICTGAGGNNHDALVPVWAVLADADHFGALAIEEKAEIVGATADPSIVVPTTEAGIEAMDADDAVAAAMYRYDYCTSKYNLTAFVTGRSVPAYNSTISIIIKNVTNDIATIVAISVITLVIFGSVTAFFTFRRKEN